MSALIQFIAWEWVNIALEYTAVSWSRLPNLFLTVVVVNLVTHPIFTLLLARFGRSPYFILPCEAVIFFVEWVLLTAIYDRTRWRYLALVAFVMNATSFGTGLLMLL